MKIKLLTKILTFFLVFTFLLQACGRKGPLYLPKDVQTIKKKQIIYN